MDWYYAVGGEQKGPVTERELERIATQGIITADTLVWREGLANWQRFADTHLEISSTPILAPLPPATPPGGGVYCAGCGGVFQGTDVISLSGGLYCAACKPAALQRLREGESTSSAAEAVRKEHLKHEASVKSIGVLYYLGGAALLLMGGVTFLAGLAGLREGGEALVAVFLAVVFLLIGAGQIWVGHGLRRLKPWARIPTGILSGLGLLGFPIGTIINGYILYLIFSQKGKAIFSPEYQRVVEQTPHIKYRTSMVVWVILGFVVFAIVFAIVMAGLRAR